jgi:hypothetical protein
MSFLVLVFFIGLLAFGAAFWWLHQPLSLQPQPGSQVLDLEIEPGTPAQRVAEAVQAMRRRSCCMPGFACLGRPARSRPAVMRSRPAPPRARC